MMNNIEKRLALNDNNIQLRARTEEGKKYISGYAATFDQYSRLIVDWAGVYFEKLERGAFDEALVAEDVDVVYYFNHDNQSMPIARYRNKPTDTLKLRVDDYGLFFDAELANTTDANDLYELVLRGDLDSNSFAFTVAEDEWQYGAKDGYDVRNVVKVARLYDVSTVTKAAYPSAVITEAAKRSYDAQKPVPQPEEDVERLKMETELLSMRLYSNKKQIK